MIVKLRNDRDYNLSVPEQVLFNRGIGVKSLNEYLNTNDSVLVPYNKLKNIEIAKNCLLKHISDGSKILIQADCDVDGYSSAAFMYNYLKINFNGIEVDYQVHDSKFHGLDVTKDILDKKYALIIIPDASSNEYETHKKLADLGIDIIILDHHECEYESPDAIVVNNQISEDYPNKSLCGVGVVYKFCQLLDEDDTLNLHAQDADHYLDLTAFGLVADMSTLLELETKRLIEKGISNMRDGIGNDFLLAIIKKQSFSLKGEVTPFGISMYIAPLINAVVRIGTPEERLIAFEAFLYDKQNQQIPSNKRGHKPGDMETVIDQALRTLTNVKNRQTRKRDEAFEHFNRIITPEFLSENSIILLKTNETFLDKGMNGLVANQIMNKYKRPTLILTEIKDDKGNIVSYSGSARSFESSKLENFKQFIADSGYSNLAMGHPSAFGAGFTAENLELFMKYSNEVLDFSNIQKEYEVDFIFGEADLQEQIAFDIASLKDYWGKDVEESLILIKDLKVTNNSKVLMSRDKNPTLKFTINGISYIKFKSGEEEFNSVAPNEYTSTLIDVIGKCSINEYNGNTTAQIIVQDYEIKQNLMDF